MHYLIVANFRNRLIHLKDKITRFDFNFSEIKSALYYSRTIIVLNL